MSFHYSIDQEFYTEFEAEQKIAIKNIDKESGFPNSFPKILLGVKYLFRFIFFNYLSTKFIFYRLYNLED